MTDTDRYAWGGPDDPFADWNDTPAAQTPSPGSHEWGPGDPFHDDFHTSPTQSPAVLSDPQPSREPRRMSRRSVLTAGGGLLLLAAAGGGGAMWLNRPDSPPSTGGPSTSPSGTPSPTPKTLSRACPPGWGTAARWKVPLPTSTAIGVGHGKVAALGQSRELLVLDADTGKTLFTSAPQDTLTSRAVPMVSAAGGVPVAVVVDGSTVMLWRLDKLAPNPSVLVLPAGAGLSAAGGGLLVASQLQAWTVSDKLRMVPAAMPGGNRALSVDESGALLSAPQTGPASITPPGGKPKVLPAPKPPKGTLDKLHVARGARGVLGVWWTPAKGKGRVIGAATMDGKLLGSASVAEGEMATGLPLVVAADGKHAAFGPLLVDAAPAKVTLLAGFAPTSADSVQVYGTRNGARVAATASAKPLDLDPLTAIPWGLSATGRAVVLDRDAGVTMLAALDRA